jgi:hypothetical protein
VQFLTQTVVQFRQFCSNCFSCWKSFSFIWLQWHLHSMWIESDVFSNSLFELIFIFDSDHTIFASEDVLNDTFT